MKFRIPRLPGIFTVWEAHGMFSPRSFHQREIHGHFIERAAAESTAGMFRGSAVHRRDAVVVGGHVLLVSSVKPAQVHGFTPTLGMAYELLSTVPHISEDQTDVPVPRTALANVASAVEYIKHRDVFREARVNNLRNYVANSPELDREHMLKLMEGL